MSIYVQVFQPWSTCFRSIICITAYIAHVGLEQLNHCVMYPIVLFIK